MGCTTVSYTTFTRSAESLGGLHTLSYTGGAFALLLALSDIIGDWIGLISFIMYCVLTVVIRYTSACR